MQIEELDVFLNIITITSATTFNVRGYSSVVEHSTADREVPGSIPGAPLNFLFFLFLSMIIFY